MLTVAAMLTLALASLAFPRSASACSCTPIGAPSQAIDGTRAVFVGRVVRIVETSGWNVVTFNVTETFHQRSPEMDRVNVHTMPSVDSCGFAFNVGTSYLVYAGTTPDGGLTASYCSRTQRAFNAGNDLAYLRTLRQEPTETARFLLDAGMVGQLESGMLVEDVYRLFGRSNVAIAATFPEGIFQAVLRITLPGSAAKPALIAEIDRWPCGQFTVGRVTVMDPRFRTRDGLGVGTTEAELRRRFSFTIEEAEGCHCAFIKSLNLTFRLSGPPAAQRVSSVLVIADPVAIRAKRCPHVGPI